MKQSMWKLRRAAAWLLTLFLLTGEIGGIGMKAYAADEDEQDAVTVVAEDDDVEAVTEAEDGDGSEEALPSEDVPEDEEEYPDDEGREDLLLDYPLYIYLNGVKIKSGTLDKLHDTPKWGYSKGVLILGDGFELTKDFTNSKLTPIDFTPSNYGISCNGALTITVNGTATIDMSGRSNATAGIYTTGDLTITNVGANTGELNILEGTKGGGAGIVCMGDLTIRHANSRYGSGKIIVTEGALLGSISVRAEGTKYSGSFDRAYTSGIRVDGNMSVADANVEAYANDNPSGESIAVDVYGDLTVYQSRLYAKPGTAKEIKMAKGIRAEHITLDQTHVSKPVRGGVGSAKGTKTFVTNSKGGFAYNQHVEISRGTAYGLWLGNTAVTTENYRNLNAAVTGTGATASYDPKSNILSLSKVTGFNGTAPASWGVSYIYTSVPLTVRGEEVNIATDQNCTILAAECDGTVDLAGNFAFETHGYGIRCSESANLLINGDHTELQVTNDGEDQPAVFAQGGFKQEGGNVTVNALKADGIATEGKAIELEGGSLVVDAYQSALYAGQNEVSISEYMSIIEPDGAHAGKKEIDPGEYFGTILDKDGNACTYVKIKTTVHPLTVNQTGTIYGNPLPDPDVTGGVSDAERTISYNGYLDKDGSYFESLAPVVPDQAGSYRVTVTDTKGEDSWRGSAEFKILPAGLEATVKAVDRAYEEVSGTPNIYVEISQKAEDITLDGIKGSDDVELDLSTAVGVMTSGDAGTDKPVTVTGAALSGADAGNYKLHVENTKVTISKTEWTNTESTFEVTEGQEIKDEDISALLAPGGSFGTAVVKQGSEQLAAGPNISGTKLSLKMKDTLSQDVLIEIPVTGATNYNDYNVELTLIVPHTCTPEPVAEVPAGCVTEGVASHFECPVCHKLYKDAEGKEPVNEEDLLIPPAGHKWDDGIVEEKPTPDKDGKMLYTCTVCHATKNEVIPKGTIIHSPLDPVPENLDKAAVLYLVKGQKFTLSANWVIVDKKTNGKFISVSKKGVVKAKKETSAPVTISHNSGRMIEINICKPVIVKKLRLDAVGDAAGKQIKLEGCGTLDVYWYSANPDVATVNQSGWVTPVAKGNAKITAYINGTAYNCTVNVKENSAIALSRTLHLNTNGKKSVSIKGMKEWTGGVEGVAGAKKKTIIAGSNPGTAVFTTSANSTTYTLNVRVEDISLKIAEGSGLSSKGKNKYSLEITAGQNIDLSFTDVEQPLVFKSSKPETVFADENGCISARTAGKGKITTKINGKTVTIDVTVKAAP